jgi:hypothetical protein
LTLINPLAEVAMKTEVYSWRVSQEVKTELEREARRRKISVAALLEVAARELLSKSDAEDDGGHQQARLQKAAYKCFGAFEGGDTHRSETVRQEIRRRLRQRNGC